MVHWVPKMAQTRGREGERTIGSTFLWRNTYSTAQQCLIINVKTAPTHFAHINVLIIHGQVADLTLLTSMYSTGCGNIQRNEVRD